MSRDTALVETMGLEPTTSCLQSRRSSQLSYVPGEALIVRQHPPRARSEPAVTRVYDVGPSTALESMLIVIPPYCSLCPPTN
jgi:hypothetical protein